MGSELSQPITDKNSEDGAFQDKLLWSVADMQGWRCHMEDAHFVYMLSIAGQQAFMVGVFDGHGGDLVAKEAAKRIPSLMNAAMGNIRDPSNATAIGVQMQTVFMILDEELKTLDPIQRQDDQSGCTAIVSIITSTHIITANAGDSRGILVQGDNTVVALSEDHKPSNPGEKTRIEEAGGCVTMRRVNGELAVSRALGDYTYKNSGHVEPKDQMVTAYPDIHIVKRDGEEQFLMLACDGIWDVLSNEAAGARVQELIRGKYRGEPLSKVNERLLDLCLEKGSRDNMTTLFVVNTDAITPGEDVKPPDVIQQEVEALNQSIGHETQTLRV